MFNLSETAKISCHYEHLQQLELSLGKRTELICALNIKIQKDFLYYFMFNDDLTLN